MRYRICGGRSDIPGTGCRVAIESEAEGMVAEKEKMGFHMGVKDYHPNPRRTAATVATTAETVT